MVLFLFIIYFRSCSENELTSRWFIERDRCWGIAVSYLVFHYEGYHRVCTPELSSCEQYRSTFLGLYVDKNWQNRLSHWVCCTFPANLTITKSMFFIALLAWGRKGGDSPRAHNRFFIVPDDRKIPWNRFIAPEDIWCVLPKAKHRTDIKIFTLDSEFFFWRPVFPDRWRLSVELPCFSK